MPAGLWWWCAALAGFFAFNLSPLKPEQLLDFLSCVCCDLSGGGILQGQLYSEHLGCPQDGGGWDTFQGAGILLGTAVPICGAIAHTCASLRYPSSGSLHTK